MITLEKHLAAHTRVTRMRLATCVCGWELPMQGSSATELHAAHVAESWREARTIRTPEDLDALPNGSIYVSDGHGLAEQKAGDVWFAARCSQPFEPDLPGVVVWLPEDGAL